MPTREVPDAPVRSHARRSVPRRRRPRSRSGGRPGRVAPTAAVAAPSTDYVALGDSYSSGTGTNAYDLSATCQRSSRAYPPLWAAQQGTASFAFAACATFLDARGAYAGHEVCSGSPWLNGTTLPVTDSYHPNRSGYAQGYLRLLRGTAT